MAWSLVIPEEVACSCEVGEGGKPQGQGGCGQEAEEAERASDALGSRHRSLSGLAARGTRHAARGRRLAAGPDPPSHPRGYIHDVRRDRCRGEFGAAGAELTHEFAVIVCREACATADLCMTYRTT